MMRAMLRARLRARDEDGGFGLVFVLLMIVIAMAMVTTATAALFTQYNPTNQTIKNGAAVAAAEAGIEDFVAKVNQNCPETDGFYCLWLDTTNGLSSNATVIDPLNQRGTCVVSTATAANDCRNGTVAGDQRESFVWTVIPLTASVASPRTPGVARIKSVGQVPAGPQSPNKYMTATLVADIQASPSFTNFEYFTKYETFPPDFFTGFYRPRTIQFVSGSNGDESSSQLAGAGSGTLQWAGACSTVGNSSCDKVHSVDICNDLYFPSAYGPGRGTDTAWDNNNGRRPSAAVMAAMGTDSSFSYWSENGTFTKDSGGSLALTHNDTCDSTMEPNMYMNGPVYSEDAYLIDRGKDTGNAGAKCGNKPISMPVFCDWAYSNWNGVVNGTQSLPNALNGGYNRSYTNTDGQMGTDLAPQPVFTTRQLNLPSDGSGAMAYATCTYTGPTRILVKGSTAYITSPMTPTVAGDPCYTSTGNYTAGTGVVDAQITPLNKTLIYVKNPTATPTAATPTNKVFNLTASIGAGSPSASNTLAGSWTDNSTYSVAQNCPSPADPTKRRNFDCETGTLTPRGDMATKISNIVNTTLQAGATDTATMQTNLQNAIKGLMNSNSLDPSKIGTQGYYYTVTVSNVTKSQSSPTAPLLSPADPFFQQGSSGTATLTSMTANINISRVVCGNGGGCSNVNATTIYSGTATGSWGTGTATSTASFPWFGKQPGDAGYDASKTYTDPNNDVTQYLTNEGDAYVEGTLNGQMSIVSEHDIVVTNNLLYNNTNVNTTTDGMALVATHNVRVYRPMTCSDDGTAGVTTTGYCPDDLSGIYNAPASWPMPGNFPSGKYVPDAAPSMFSGSSSQQLYATIFTLQGCFMVDNFYRGALGQSITMYGGLYQNHRGPTSLPYQGRPYQGSANKMPGVVLTYNYDNMRSGQATNGGLRVPWVPSPRDTPVGSTRTWNVTQIGTGS